MLLMLAALLTWSGSVFYTLEQEQLNKKIDSTIISVSARLQNENMTLNNLMHSYSDDESDEKVAFAAGITGNTGKLQITFEGDEYEETLPDTIPSFNRDTLEKMNIRYIPEGVKTISYFDSLLQDTLSISSLEIPYNIVMQEEDPMGFMANENKGIYTYSTPSLIINFYQPEVFKIYYNIPGPMIIKRLWLFWIVAISLVIISALTFRMYYKSYKLQEQMTLFKENLFSNMTHELKTPLSSLQLILHNGTHGDKTISEQNRQFALEELDRMNLLISRIIAYGKLNDEQFALNKEVVNISAIIQDAVNIMSVVAENHKAIITYDVSSNIRIAGDRMLLTNLFSALLDNAIKYSSTEPFIKITGTQGNGWVQISVADNGTGIPSEYKNKVTEPFFRVPQGDVHNVKGQGIGLSFVKQVTELHKGKIEIADNENGGTTIIIKLPV